MSICFIFKLVLLEWWESTEFCYKVVQNCFIENSPHVEMFHCNVRKRKMCWLDEYKRRITNWAWTIWKPDCVRARGIVNTIVYKEYSLNQWIKCKQFIDPLTIHPFVVMIVSPWQGVCLRPHKNLLFDFTDWLTLAPTINLGSKWA